jgi:beta-N-acetylhexosaminidase
MAVFGHLHRADRDAAARATWLNARLLGAELHDLGINVDCAPVLDLPESGADPIIGDRAFGTDAGIVADLGAAFVDGLNAAGVLAVIKHIPGHGRADVDSHLKLPRVASPAAELAATDFAPFKALSGRPAPQPWAMTAHVVFEAIDPKNPATLSASVIEDAIRGQGRRGRLRYQPALQRKDGGDARRCPQFSGPFRSLSGQAGALTGGFAGTRGV